MATDQPYKLSKPKSGTPAKPPKALSSPSPSTSKRDTTSLTRIGISKYDPAQSPTQPSQSPNSKSHTSYLPGRTPVPPTIKKGAQTSRNGAPKGANVSETNTTPVTSHDRTSHDRTPQLDPGFKASKEFYSEEARRKPSVKVLKANPANARRIASERVRTKVRRVKQSVQLGGYWTFRGGKPVFVSTVGRGASVRGTRRKPNKPPTPNQTINTATRKTKEKLVKRPKKKSVPDNLKKVRGYR